MNRYICALPFFALVAALAACSATPDPFSREHPTIDGRPVPMGNAPYSPEIGTPPTQPDAAPSLPPGDFAMAMVVRDRKSVTGGLQLAGSLRRDGDAILLTPPGGSPVNIPYRLPAAMPAPLALPATGHLDFHDVSTPGGAHIKLLLADSDGRPLFMHVWEVRRAPLDIEIGGGVRLTQIPVAQQAGPGMVAARLAIVDNGRVLGLPEMGQTITLATSAGVIAVTPEISVLAVPAPGVQDPDYPHYILRAWVTGGLPSSEGGGLLQIPGDNMQAAPTGG